MFLENTLNLNEQFGWIEVICGSMFSGKTEELIRPLKCTQFGNQKIEIFKPAINSRCDYKMIPSHDSNQIPSTSVPTGANIPILANESQVVGIDEVQFFDDEIVEVYNDLANSGMRVIVAGLDMDDQENPFGPMPAFMATAEHVTKLHAIFVKTGNLAQCNHRKSDQEDSVLLGVKDDYEPLNKGTFSKASDK
jgi:thymidine kinase